jgi:hypothetical protein
MLGHMLVAVKGQPPCVYVHVYMSLCVCEYSCVAPGAPVVLQGVFQICQGSYAAILECI